MKKLLWWVAGAEQDILTRPEYANERGLYAAVGSTVLMTGAFASISSIYALCSIFGDLKIAIGLGLFWGFTIASIDRFLIMTTQKTNKFSWGGCVTLAVRLVLVVAIGITLAKPLEAAIFQKEIQAEIASSNLAAEVKMRQTTAQLSESVEIERLRKENQQLERQKDTLNTEYQTVYNSTIGEAEGTSGTGKAGKGPVYDKKLQELERQKAVLVDSNNRSIAQIYNNNRQIVRLEKTLKTKVDGVNKDRVSANSIIAQIKMLHEMAEKDMLIKLASILISLIFISIDVMPILSKFLMPRTAYDAIKCHERNATVLLQDALDKNLPNELAKEISRRDTAEDNLDRLSGYALIEALKIAQDSQETQEVIAKTARNHIQRISRELAVEIDKVHTPKSKLAEEAKKAVEQEIPSLAKNMVNDRFVRRRLNNLVEDLSGQLEQTVNNFKNRNN